MAFLLTGLRAPQLELQPEQDFLPLIRHQAPHFGSMNPADQYVARDPVKDAIRPQMPTAAVFVDLGRVSGAELRVKTLKVPAHFLAGLLETDRPVGFRDSAGPV